MSTLKVGPPLPAVWWGPRTSLERTTQGTSGHEDQWQEDDQGDPLTRPLETRVLRGGRVDVAKGGRTRRVAVGRRLRFGDLMGACVSRRIDARLVSLSAELVAVEDLEAEGMAP